MRRLTYCLALILLLGSMTLPPAFASGIGVVLNQSAVAFTADTGYPFIDSNGRTLVPFRLVLERFGCSVQWAQQTGTASAYKNATLVEVPVGSATIRINGTAQSTDTAAVIRDGRVYLPIRPVAEAFGAAVSWDAANQAVVITDGPEKTENRPAATGGTALSEKQLYQVKNVIDGDTFRLSDGQLVRMIGIDSPEADGPYTTREYYSDEATAALKQLIEGQKVYLEKDVSETDKYDRLLRYVYSTDGRNLNIYLVETGCARAVSYPPDTRYLTVLKAAEAMARQNRAGIWNETP